MTKLSLGWLAAGSDRLHSGFIILVNFPRIIPFGTCIIIEKSAKFYICLTKWVNWLSASMWNQGHESPANLELRLRITVHLLSDIIGCIRREGENQQWAEISEIPVMASMFCHPE